MLLNMKPAPKVHPAIVQTSMKNQVGYDRAEVILRGESHADPEAAKVIREIDQARAEHKAHVASVNADMFQRLGLDAQGVRKLVACFAEDKELWTWFTSRVHLTMCHGRHLESHEHVHHEPPDAEVPLSLGD